MEGKKVPTYELVVSSVVKTKQDVERRKATFKTNLKKVYEQHVSNHLQPLCIDPKERIH